LHYALTLRALRERFLDRNAEVKALGFDETFVKMWEYYLFYCEGAFREAYVGEAQLLLKKKKPLWTGLLS
jgi:cyclopropane-fatty-acyl-phospholipid synthase